MVESLTCDMCVTFVWQEKLHQFVHCDHRDHFNMWHSVTKVWHRMAPLLSHWTKWRNCHTWSHHVTLCYTPMSLGHISINLQILLFRKYVPMVIVISNSEHVIYMLGVWNLLEPVIKSTTIHHFLTGNEGFSFLFFPCAFHILFLFLFHKPLTSLNM